MKILCTLCLNNSHKAVNVFDEHGINSHIIDVLYLHFSFMRMKPFEEVSKYICCSCWSKVNDFHSFYISIQEAHKKLTESSTPKDNSFQNVKKSFKRGKYEGDNWSNEPTEYIDVIPVSDDISSVQLDGINVQDSSKINECKFDNEKKDLENETILKRKLNNISQLDLESGNANVYDGDYEANEKEVEKARLEIEIIPPVPVAKKERGRLKKKLTNASDSEEDLPLTHFIKNKKKQSEWSKKSKEDDDKIANFMKLKCEICFDEFLTFAKIKQHYREYHNKKGYVMCCNKKLYKRILLLDHVNKHINPEYFKCVECNKSFSDKQCLKNHMLRHESDESKIFKCDKCPRKYSKQYLLEQHKFIHVPPEERHFICEDCGKAYGSYKLLRVHKNNAHTRKPKQKRICEICAKVFTNRIFFEKHQNEEHFGQKLPPAQCKICKSWFKNELTIRFHMKRHEEQNLGKLFECDICGKQATTRCAIKTHKQYAHSEKKFKCYICDKAFKRAINLKEHITVHTGERLYTCSFCTKTFNSNANMHAHRKRAHPTEWAADKKQKLFLKLSHIVETENDEALPALDDHLYSRNTNETIENLSSTPLPNNVTREKE